MTSLEIEHLNLAQCVLLRPRMYTANGTLSEVLSFLDGFDMAVRNSAPRSVDISPSELLDWLRSELALVSYCLPSERLAWALEKFGSEASAMKAIEKAASQCKSKP